MRVQCFGWSTNVLNLVCIEIQEVISLTNILLPGVRSPLIMFRKQTPIFRVLVFRVLSFPARLLPPSVWQLPEAGRPACQSFLLASLHPHWPDPTLLVSLSLRRRRMWVEDLWGKKSKALCRYTAYYKRFSEHQMNALSLWQQGFFGERERDHRKWRRRHD